MKKTLLVVLILAFALILSACGSAPTTTPETITSQANPSIPSILLDQQAISTTPDWSGWDQYEIDFELGDKKEFKIIVWNETRGNKSCYFIQKEFPTKEVSLFINEKPVKTGFMNAYYMKYHFPDSPHRIDYNANYFLGTEFSSMTLKLSENTFINFDLPGENQATIIDLNTTEPLIIMIIDPVFNPTNHDGPNDTTYLGLFTVYDWDNMVEYYARGRLKDNYQTITITFSDGYSYSGNYITEVSNAIPFADNTSSVEGFRNLTRSDFSSPTPP